MKLNPAELDRYILDMIPGLEEGREMLGTTTSEKIDNQAKFIETDSESEDENESEIESGDQSEVEIDNESTHGIENGIQDRDNSSTESESPLIIQQIVPNYDVSVFTRDVDKCDKPSLKRSGTNSLRDDEPVEKNCRLSIDIDHPVPMAHFESLEPEQDTNSKKNETFRTANGNTTGIQPETTSNQIMFFDSNNVHAPESYDINTFGENYVNTQITSLKNFWETNKNEIEKLKQQLETKENEIKLIMKRNEDLEAQNKSLIDEKVALLAEKERTVAEARAQALEDASDRISAAKRINHCYSCGISIPGIQYCTAGCRRRSMIFSKDH